MPSTGIEGPGSFFWPLVSRETNSTLKLPLCSSVNVSNVGVVSTELGTPFSIPPHVSFLSCLVGICIFTYFVFITTYNLYYHPLAKIPGPLLGRATSWYLVFVICSVPTLGHELHKKYGMSRFLRSGHAEALTPGTVTTGPIVRLAPNMLSFSDATLLPIIYNNSADKPNFYDSWIFGRVAAMFQTLNNQDHHAKKRLVAPCVGFLSKMLMVSMYMNVNQIYSVP